MTSGVAPIVKVNSQIPSHTGNPDSSQPKTHFGAMGKSMMNNMGLCDEYGRRLCILHPRIDSVNRERVVSDLKDALEHTYGHE